jgi:hypothetical protein
VTQFKRQLHRLFRRSAPTRTRRPSEPGGADSGVRLLPEKSVLKYQEGDEIKVTEAGFELISKAFFAEIGSKYS